MSRSKARFGAVGGLDLSLAGTGGVMLDDDGKVVSTLAFSTSKREVAAASKYGRDHLILSPEVKQGDAHSMWSRTVFVTQQIMDWVRMWSDSGCLFVIEDHAYGARGTSIYQLGHLHGLVRHALQQAGHQWLLVAPTELKAAVTGKGNADKDAMMSVPTPGLDQKKFGTSTRNNVVDAYWLAKLGGAYFDAHMDEWLDIPESMVKVLKPHAKRPGLMMRRALP